MSETEIKVGFLVINIAGVEGAGFAVGLRPDGHEYAQALGAYINNRGGVAGRAVVVESRNTDPTQFSDGAAACRSMVEDRKVFAVFDSGATGDPATYSCFAEQNQTPYFNKFVNSDTWYERMGGFQVTSMMSTNRIADNWIGELADIGWFASEGQGALDAGTVVGIVANNCESSREVFREQMPALLRAIPDVSDVVVAETDCTIEGSLSQAPTLVTQLRAAGATHVMFPANFGTVTVFMNTAQNQGYRPKYTASDWYILAADAQARNFPPEQADGMLAVTSYVYPKVNAGVPAYPSNARCSEVAVEAGLEPLDGSGDEAEILGWCSHFFLWAAAMQNAGANPTRAAWRDAHANLGAFESAITGPATYRPGKLTGSDTVYLAEWRADCICWNAISESTPARA